MKRGSEAVVKFAVLEPTAPPRFLTARQWLEWRQLRAFIRDLSSTTRLSRHLLCYRSGVVAQRNLY